MKRPSPPTKQARAGRLLHEREGWYYLLDEEGPVLHVLVGTIALYEVRLRLDPEEIARYQREGTPFIDTLAEDIVQHEPRYRSAGRTEVSG